MPSRHFSRRDLFRFAIGGSVVAWAHPLRAIEQASGSDLTRPDLRLVVRKLEERIARSLIEAQIPSMTVALVDGGEVVWSGGYGHANLWARTPAVPSSVYYVGSIYKSVNAAAMMQLVERGSIGLDHPVRDYLPFPIRGERADRPIRVRHLLTHVSGFGGNPPGIHHDVWGDTTPPPLEDYLRDQARVERPPEEALVYSNLAFTLAGFLIERVSGVEYREYVRRNIFEPLGMEETEFVPSPRMRERLAVPYGFDDEEQLVPVPQLKTNHYPAGAVWSPVRDLAIWLAANLNGGVLNGGRVLSEAGIAEMHRPQYPQFANAFQGFKVGDPDRTTFGLGWLTSEQNGERLIGHSGSLPGYTSFVEGNVARRQGIAIMTNRVRAHDHLVALGEYALALLMEYL